MPTEVCSPINRKGSAVGSGPPMSLGARSNLSRACADSAPEPKQQLEADARRSKRPAPASAKLFGPEE
jgi:hypothetical protein